MQARFESFIKENELFKKTDKLLLAISGGVDSVALCHLLKEGGYNFSLAHCNFKLRGKESGKDEQFCKKLAEKLKVNIHTTGFDTKAYSKKHGLSTQMAARHLRYNWFASLMAKDNYTYLLTAHHAGDNTETILINLLRGTGINGLKGIPYKNQNIVRPLLNFTKEEIISFAKNNKLKFREDKSNEEDKYKRNYLRLKVIPKLKKIRPDIDGLFLENSRRFSEEAAIVKEYIDEKLISILNKKDGVISINRSGLEKEKFQNTLIHHLLSSYGFSKTQKGNLLNNLQTKSISGKKYLSPTHELHLERDEIVITLLNAEPDASVKIEDLNDLKKYFKISKVTKIGTVKPTQILIEKNRLIFPLLIRAAITGDKFRPFGMKGFKLLSDFYKDKKFSALQKNQTQLLVNGNGEIMWVIGHRSDDRYKIGNNAKDILKLNVIEGK